MRYDEFESGVTLEGFELTKPKEVEMEQVYLRLPMDAIMSKIMDDATSKKGDIASYQYYFDPTKNTVIVEMYVETKE